MPLLFKRSFFRQMSLKKKITLGVLVAVVIAVLVFLNPPAGKPGGPETERFLRVGPHEVLTEDFEVVDTSRPMEANSDFKGKDERKLKGKIWRPAEQGIYPFLVYSHGYMASHKEGAYVTAFLASHGYIVVAVDYPLTNYFAPGGAYLADVVNQPGDVSFIIDQVLNRNNEEVDALYQQSDTDRIGVLGVSLGGMTTTLVTFDGRQQDRRGQ
jgi:predicted dienelactone hydrolase